MRLSKQTIALAVVGVADLVSTLWLWRIHGATEANPLMARFLAHSVVAFIVAKLMFLAIPLAVIEWARRQRPTFVARAGTVAVLAYVGLYAVGVARLNAEPPSRAVVSPAVRRATWDHLRLQMAQRVSRGARSGKATPSLSLSYALAAYRDAARSEPPADGPM